MLEWRRLLKGFSDTPKFLRKKKKRKQLLCDSLLFFVLFFKIKQKLCFSLKGCLCTFSKWEMRTISCYWKPGYLYGGREAHVSVPLCVSGVAGWRGSMFSHTLGRRTLKCYLMLAGVHVDTVGFFRRASESMHNNFAIYCGLVMVQCRCYIG